MQDSFGFRIMTLRPKTVLLFAMLQAGLTFSTSSTGDDSETGKRLYRYYNDKGVPMLSDQVTEEHVRRGYEIVDKNMQVIMRVPPFDEASYQKDRVKREALLRQQAEDARILRLYSSSHDAELARNRQLDTLETSIGYNALQLLRLKRLRADSVEQAAELERAGKAANPRLKSQIDQYDRQISELQSLINSQRAEQTKVKNDFIPIIKRLAELESKSPDGNASTVVGSQAGGPGMAP